MTKLPKAYVPREYEAKIYKQWEDSDAFKPSGQGEPFCIVMPPPNANGSLHWGHAVGYSLEDVVTRYKRMQGFNTLWLPGTDHAGIETQFVYERDVLTPQGRDRFDLGPQKFYTEVMKFTLQQQDNILSQFRSMGFSADWSRLKFTLDEDIIDIVYQTFRQLHADGHVYRGPRIVNWCPRCQAAFADIEVDRREQTDDFYTLQYGPFQIATARPETKFGDKYVVMHPDDQRYSKYKEGDTFTAEWINGPVTATVIKDEAIDPQFGTGVMTITPWHDATDFAIAERHGLDKQQIIDMEGKLLPVAGEFAGLPITEARPKIVEKLKNKGLLVKTEQRSHAIGVHDRDGALIEPQISEQWFLKIKELNKAVIAAFQKDITMFPKRFTKIALNWLEQEHDWCISRQVWWGIRIPVFYYTGKDKAKKPYIIATDEAEATKYYGKGNYRAETDTFDTWFSSGQWPYATLMTTGKADFETFYPTALMATAREILHKWVTRMVMFGLYKTKQVPFKDVYLWGLVTDEHGAKMSKSKGNVIDPLAMTAKYGTDALRLAGALTNTPGNDSPLGEKALEAQRNFCNKLWNVARFVLDKTEGVKPEPKPQSIADEWMLERLNRSISTITAKIDQYRLNEAANAVYHLLWDDMADWYIEASKSQPNPGVLLYSLQTVLKLAHPFIPFVTEAIWQALPDTKDHLLITTSWPQTVAVAGKGAADFELLKAMVTEIRTLTAELELAKPTLYYQKNALVAQNTALLQQLAGLASVEQVSAGSGLALSSSNSTAWLAVDQSSISKYQQKLQARQQTLQNRVNQLEKQLANKEFTKNAPKPVLEERKGDLEQAKSQLQTLDSQLKQLQ